MRRFATTTNSNSCHVGLDQGANIIAGTPGLYLNFSTTGQWSWSGMNSSGVRRTINVPTTGLHTLHLWMREAGLKIDQVLVSTDISDTPPSAAQTPRPRAEFGALWPGLAAQWTLPAGTGHGDFTYHRATAHSGSFFFLEYSPDLSTWQLAHGAQTLGIPPAGAGVEAVTLRWPIPEAAAGSPKLFVRIREEWLGGP